MVIGIFYKDINTDVGDAFDVRSIVQNLAKNNDVYVFCSEKNKHKVQSNNIVYLQTNSLLKTAININRLSKKIDYMHLFCGLAPSIPFLSFLLQVKKIRYTYSPFGQLMPLAIEKNNLINHDFSSK